MFGARVVLANRSCQVRFIVVGITPFTMRLSMRRLRYGFEPTISHLREAVKPRSRLESLSALIFAQVTEDAISQRHQRPSAAHILDSPEGLDHRMGDALSAFIQSNRIVPAEARSFCSSSHRFLHSSRSRLLTSSISWRKKVRARSSSRTVSRKAQIVCSSPCSLIDI